MWGGDGGADVIFQRIKRVKIAFSAAKINFVALCKRGGGVMSWEGKLPEFVHLEGRCHGKTELGKLGLWSANLPVI